MQAKRLRTIIPFAAALLLGANLAQASPVHWSIDAVFDDGGTVTGSFIFDADTTSCSAINIMTTSGTAFAGATYTNEYQCFNTFLAVTTIPLGSDLNGGSILSLGFSAPLTNAGGVIVLSDLPGPIYPDEASCDFSSTDTCISAETFRRTGIVNASTVTGSPVPIPAAAWLLGSALAGLGWLRRKK